VNVDAASFLSACPGAIFVLSDTTLVGSATVTGDCTVSSSGPQFNLSQAKLTFTGFFKVLGNASSLTVDRSKVTTGGALVLDSQGLMTISGSTLSVGGSVNLPPRDGLEVTHSSIAASGGVTVGGQGGLRTFTDSNISAGNVINIANSPSQINVLHSNLSAGIRITLGGNATALSIDRSTLEAFGTGATSFEAAILIAPGGAGQWDITSSTLSAPAGAIYLGGSGYFLVEDTKVSSGADILVKPGGAAGNTFRRAQFKSTLGALSFSGSGSDVFEDSKLEAGGESSGHGIQFGASSGPSITRATIQASAGGIRFDGQGDVIIIKSTLTAEGASGIFISSGNRRIPLWPSEVPGRGSPLLDHAQLARAYGCLDRVRDRPRLDRVRDRPRPSCAEPSGSSPPCSAKTSPRSLRASANAVGQVESDDRVAAAAIASGIGAGDKSLDPVQFRSTLLPKGFGEPP
jgi:hypothetical protein